MRVLQIVADGNPGGGTTFVLEMVSSLEDPILITQKESYALEAAGDIPKYGIDFFTSRLDLRISLQLKKVIDKVQPDLIHVHGGRAAFFLSFVPIRCPILFTVHGLHGIHGKVPLSRWGYRRAIKRFQGVVFVSHREEELALKHDLIRGANHCVIPNGIDPQKLPKRRQVREKLLAFVGRVCAEKDPLFLLKVMEILGPKGYHLKVIGGGELEEEMKQSPHVTVTGRLSRLEAMHHFAEVERVLIPSVWEACALLPLEAMALGIPIIASHIPAFEEVLASGPYATLIAQKDPQKWAEAVLAEEDYTQAAKQYFEENYRWERCLNTYRALYEKMSSRSSAESSRHSPS
ncbi:MAG: glycosyltransferase family 4 protein [Chlamydiia bacterium]|nr:glycosyltransferase family 4 protein [Chlamydiia bacterium]